jgi:hypothetical protein
MVVSFAAITDTNEAALNKKYIKTSFFDIPKFWNSEF